MSTPPSPFDSERDPRLGDALHRVLDAGDTAAFVARVLARVAAGPAPWDVLAGWARPGIAAALAAAMAAGVLVGRMASPRQALEDALVSTGTGPAAVVLESPDPPDLGVMFASWPEP